MIFGRFPRFAWGGIKVANNPRFGRELAQQRRFTLGLSSCRLELKRMSRISPLPWRPGCSVLISYLIRKGAQLDGDTRGGLSRNELSI
jgi:hypothetical protein